jgi:cob(I)alamin adenosyltransferase
MEANGTVDELNAALGLARSFTKDASAQAILLPIQKDLIGLMGELATAPEDVERYCRDGFAQLKGEQTAGLENAIKQLESAGRKSDGWATPGSNSFSAALDVARTICRRAERRVCDLNESNDLRNDEIIIYLNRLSDLCWLLARWAETNVS